MFRFLGIVAGVISLTIMMWKGFHLSFGPTLQRVLEVYEAEMQAFFALVEPLVTELLVALRRLYSVDLQLYAHWKHVFVLMWLYFGATARTAWSLGNRGSAAFEVLWGGTIAFICGVAAGTVALISVTSNMLMAVIPFAGLLVYEVGTGAWAATYFRTDGRSWWGDLFYRVQRYNLPRIVVGGGALLIGTQADKIPIVQHWPNPGLALLAVFVVALAVSWVLRGARYQRGTGNTSWERFYNDGATRIGLLMLATIGGALGVVALGALGV